MASTERGAAGLDLAIAGQHLGHKLVQTVTISYTVLDPRSLAASAGRLAAQYPLTLTASAIQVLLGISQRQADAVRSRTGGRVADVLAYLCCDRRSRAYPRLS